MSFFNKLFAPEQKSQPKSSSKPTQDSIQTKKLKIEAAINELDNMIVSFEDKEKKNQHRIDVIKKKAKQFLQADKKKEAKKYIDEATKIQKQTQNLYLRKKILVDKKYQLEQLIMDMETFEAIDKAQINTKEIDRMNDRLQDLLLDEKDIKDQQSLLNERFIDLAGNQEESIEAENMLNDLIAQLNADKKNKIVTDKKVSVNTPAIQKQTTKAKEEDDIAEMLAGLS